MEFSIPDHHQNLTDRLAADTSLRRLAAELVALGEVRVEVLSGHKGFAGTDVIAAEVIKAGALSKVMEVVSGFLLRDRSRSLKLKIENRELEASGLSQEEQQELIEWFKEQTRFQVILQK